MSDLDNVEIQIENAENESFENNKNEEIVIENNKTKTDLKQNSEKVITPAKNAVLMNCTRLGVILNNFTIAAGVLLLLCFIGMIFYPVAIIVNFFVAIMMIIFTLGLIFLEFTFDDLIIIDGETVNKVVGFITSALPYIFGALLITAAASLVLLLIDKRNRSVPRIALSITILGTVVIGFILMLLGIIGGAK